MVEKMKTGELNAIVGVPIEFKISESVDSKIKHYDIHIVLTDDKKKYYVIAITNEEQLKFWEDLLKTIVSLLKKQSYIG